MAEFKLHLLQPALLARVILTYGHQAILAIILPVSQRDLMLLQLLMVMDVML